MAGRATTRFIEDAFPGGWSPSRRHAGVARAAAAVLRTEVADPAVASTWSALRGFRVLAAAGGLAAAPMLLDDGGGVEAVTVEALPGGRRRVRTGVETVELLVRRAGPAVEVEADGAVLRGWAVVDGNDVWLLLGGESYRFGVVPAVEAGGEGAAASGSGVVLAPMPGVVAELRVVEGQRVAVGEVVAVLESMKLFTSLPAGAAGVVRAVDCSAGETVPAGKRLVLVEPDGG